MKKTSRLKERIAPLAIFKTASKIVGCNRVCSISYFILFNIERDLKLSHAFPRSDSGSEYAGSAGCPLSWYRCISHMRCCADHFTPDHTAKEHVKEISLRKSKIGLIPSMLCVMPDLCQLVSSCLPLSVTSAYLCTPQILQIPEPDSSKNKNCLASRCRISDRGAPSPHEPLGRSVGQTWTLCSCVGLVRSR